MIYAGIGSRETPEAILLFMERAAANLAAKGYTLRSGAANGADSAFEKGCDASKGKKEIYIPWGGFNGRQHDEPTGVYCLSFMPPTVVEAAKAVARNHHPAWDRISFGGRLLHTRNVMQVLGKTLSEPVDFIICWTEGGKGEGGTGQAIRIANSYNVPVYDLAKLEDMEYVIKHISGR